MDKLKVIATNNHYYYCCEVSGLLWIDQPKISTTKKWWHLLGSKYTTQLNGQIHVLIERFAGENPARITQFHIIFAQMCAFKCISSSCTTNTIRFSMRFVWCSATWHQPLCVGKCSQTRTHPTHTHIDFAHIFYRFVVGRFFLCSYVMFWGNICFPNVIKWCICWLFSLHFPIGAHNDIKPASSRRKRKCIKKWKASVFCVLVIYSMHRCIDKTHTYGNVAIIFLIIRKDMGFFPRLSSTFKKKIRSKTKNHSSISLNAVHRRSTGGRS